MKNIYKLVLIALAVSLLIGSFVFAQNQVAEQKAAVKSFKQYIENFMQSYEEGKHERVRRGYPNMWYKEDFSLKGNYSIDVRSTNSLIFPIKGFCEFTLVRHSTAWHLSKENAESDNNFVLTQPPVKHRHTYAFQDGHWVPILRQHYSFENEWMNCDDCKDGEPVYYDEYGCWEPNAQHPVAACNQ